MGQLLFSQKQRWETQRWGGKTVATPMSVIPINPIMLDLLVLPGLIYLL